FAEDRAIAFGKSDWNASDFELEHNFIFLRTAATQDKRCAQRGMAGERQLFFGREDTHFDAVLLLSGAIARENERSFGEPHLAGQGLHLRAGQAASGSENRE